MVLFNYLHLFASVFAVQGVDMFGKWESFLKFKADIIDKETKTMEIDWNVTINVILLWVCLDLRNY
jgi:hypothetical protein